MISLKSNFLDIYDHHFDGKLQMSELVWERYSAPSKHVTKPLLLRNEQHQLLTEIGFKIPKTGAAWVLRKVYPDIDLVIYINLQGHQGQNKVKISAKEEIPVQYKGFYACEYIPGLPTSYRLLKIGNQTFWLEYSNQNRNEWRSNTGGEIVIQAVPTPFQIEFELGQYPMLAIDFVVSHGTWYAVDFNSAPGIGKEIAEIVNLTPRQIYDGVKNHILNHKENFIP
jgi:hypothetical protein